MKLKDRMFYVFLLACIVLTYLWALPRLALWEAILTGLLGLGWCIALILAITGWYSTTKPKQGEES